MWGDCLWGNGGVFLPLSIFFICSIFLCFPDRIFLCKNCSCPGTKFVDQVAQIYRYVPASSSRVLRLKLCTTTLINVILKSSLQNRVVGQVFILKTETSLVYIVSPRLTRTSRILSLSLSLSYVQTHTHTYTLRHKIN